MTIRFCGSSGSTCNTPTATLKTRRQRDSQHIRLVAQCRWDVITAPPLWSAFLVRCQIIKADEESGASAGTEAAAAVVMHVAMADTLGFHGNGDLSDGDGRIYCVAYDGHFIFSMFHFICYFIVFGFQFARITTRICISELQLQEPHACTNIISARTTSGKMHSGKKCEQSTFFF